MGLSVTQFH